VFSSSKLPLTVCLTKSADSIYKSYLGTDKFLVPSGDEERLAVWPGLKSASPFQFSGLGWKESVGDIVLSSAGNDHQSVFWLLYIKNVIFRLGSCHII
jgi:hypothetical protein